MAWHDWKDDLEIRTKVDERQFGFFRLPYLFLAIAIIVGVFLWIR